MKTFTAVVEKDSDTGLFVGYVPGFPGAHSQLSGHSIDDCAIIKQTNKKTNDKCRNIQ